MSRAMVSSQNIQVEGYQDSTDWNSTKSYSYELSWETISFT